MEKNSKLLKKKNKTFPKLNPMSFTEFVYMKWRMFRVKTYNSEIYI